jgi:hypothetical protein
MRETAIEGLPASGLFRQTSHISQCLRRLGGEPLALAESRLPLVLRLRGGSSTQPQREALDVDDTGDPAGQIVGVVHLNAEGFQPSAPPTGTPSVGTKYIAKRNMLASWVSAMNALKGLILLFCFSETWLDEGDEGRVQVPHYHYINHPRPRTDGDSGHSGGCGFLVHDSIPEGQFEQVEQHSDALWLRITDKDGGFFFVGVAYAGCVGSAPPAELQQRWIERREVFEELSAPDPEGNRPLCVLLGDLNSHMPEVATLQVDDEEFTRTPNSGDLHHAKPLQAFIEDFGLAIVNTRDGLPEATCFATFDQATGGDTLSQLAANKCCRPSVLDLALITAEHADEVVHAFEVLPLTHRLQRKA